MAITWCNERRKVADLKDCPHNPRKFTKKGMADLMQSMQRMGYIDPIAINRDGTIIGGHARKQTLIDMGVTEVDVRVPHQQLTEEQVKEALVRLNRNTAGEWDFEMLKLEFQEDDLIDWGFEKSEFNSFGSPADASQDEVPAPLPAPVSVRGDQWLLGAHVLRFGDSTMEADVKTLLSDAKPNLMVTDPPYGVDYDPAWRDELGADWVGKAKKTQRRFTHANATPIKSRSLGKVKNDDRADWTAAWALFPGNIAYVWHGGLHSAQVAVNLMDCGFKIRSQIIWVKQHFVFSRGDYHWQHEPCWYAVRDKGNWAGDRKQTTVWAINNASAFKGEKDDAVTGHGTQKPVECMRRPIENNSERGDAIYEPFSGSGTTIIAAELTGRACYAMELDPVYVDMAVIRWQNLTGKEAVHAVTGERFNDRLSPAAKTANGESKHGKTPKKAAAK